MSVFTRTFLTDFFQNIHKIEQNNWDYLRFSENHPRRKTFMLDKAVDWMDAIIKNADAYEEAFNLFEDDYSKALMIKLLEYWIIIM